MPSTTLLWCLAVGGRAVGQLSCARSRGREGGRGRHAGCCSSGSSKACRGVPGFVPSDLTACGWLVLIMQVLGNTLARSEHDLYSTRCHPLLLSVTLCVATSCGAWLLIQGVHLLTTPMQVSDDVLAHPERHSLLPLPHPFVVPGDRFREVYYWDSYWVSALVNCDQCTGWLRSICYSGMALWVVKQHLLVR